MPHQPTIGSQSLPAILQRNVTGLRADLQRHVQELTTGRAADPARHLRGDLGLISVLDSRIARLTAQEGVLISAESRAGAVQAGLGRIAAVGEDLRGTVLTVAGVKPDAAALARAARAGRAAFDDMVAALNARHAGRPLFAGAGSGDGPLPPGPTLRAAAAAAAAGAPSAAAAIQQVRDFFEDPGGAFATMFYAGADPVALAIGDSDGPLPPLPTALDPALRRALADAAIASLLDDTAGLPSLELRRAMATRLAEEQADTQAGLIALRSQVGATEAALSDRRTRDATEKDALTQTRNARLGIDPYTAASRLEAVRVQIETLHAVTARVARLSLVEYLR